MSSRIIQDYIPAGCFRCAECKGVYHLGSEEAAIEELKANFPGHGRAACSRICDSCYDKIIKRLNDGK